MKNIDRWLPSKYLIEDGKLVASRNPREVGISSRLVADIVADLYWTHLKDHCTGRLLDLGCGKVPLFLAYRDFVNENVCVDWANTFHKNDFLDYECDLAERLPFLDNSFDTIILSDVLEHLYNPGAVWMEMARILKPGGKVIMNVPFYYWVHEAPHDYFRYTEFALRRLVIDAGFSVLLLQSIGGAPEVIADILAKNLIEVRRIGRHASALVQFLCLKFINTSFGRRISINTSADFPFGYFMIVQKI